MTKVSVIIPVYNAEKYLRETIDSVLGQDFEDFELLLVDDGSKDASPAICDEYAAQDSRVQALHKTNGGVSSARNLGLDKARGEYIVFLDNDDLLYPDFLSTMVGNIGSFDYLLASYVEGGEDERKHWQDLSRLGKPSEEVVNAESRDSVRKNAGRFKLMNFGVILCTLFRRSIIDKYHIRFPQTQYEDTIFIYNYVSHCESLRKIFYEGYFYFRHSDSQGHSHKYIAEQEAIVGIDQAFHAVLTQFAITKEPLIGIFRYRLRAAIRSYLLKVIYKDTRVCIGIQLIRWRDIAHTHFLISPYKGAMSISDLMFGMMLKLMSLF